MAQLGRASRLGRRTVVAFGVIAGCLLLPCAPSRADAVLMWNNELLNVIQQTSGLLVNGPPEVAREMAMVDTAMFNAVNAATGMHYQPYAYTGGAVSGASEDAAALSAGYQVLTSIFSSPLWQMPSPAGNGPLVNGILSTLGTDYSTALAGLGTSSSVTAGVALGQSAAAAMIANRASDGSASAIVNGLTPQAPPGSGTVPGVYIPPSASGGRPEMLPRWGSVTPFGTSLAKIQNFESQLPTVQTINSIGMAAFISSPQYANYLLQTECEGSATSLPTAIISACAAAGFAPETPAQTKAALFWNDPGTTIQPPGHWLQITDTVAQDADLNELQQARLSALVSIAESDAGVGAWDVKYQENLWRPVTAIHDCSGWNPSFTTCDPSWSSVINTPPHPDYVAGHPAFSGAAATVLTDFFGTDSPLPGGFDSTSNQYCNSGTPVRDGSGNITGCLVGSTTRSDCNDLSTGGTDNSPLICPLTEHFDSFSEASSGPNGAEFSRVVGGIHTPFAVQDALTLGNLIGGEDYANNLRPVPEPPAAMLLAGGVVTLLALGRRRQRRS